ncbi:MAG: hypothetical protein LBI17_02830, partial [Rickettsiales bacterium]|nr:hypothetical protein [Rickettsiales bacterium]
MKKFAKFLGSMAVLSLLAACSSTDGGSSSATQPQKRPTNPSTIGGSGGDGSTGSGKPGAPMEAFFGTTATIKAEADAENEKRIKDSITAYNNANPGSKVNLGTNDWKDIASDALSQANPTAYITSRLAEIGTMQSAYTAY